MHEVMASQIVRPIRHAALRQVIRTRAGDQSRLPQRTGDQVRPDIQRAADCQIEAAFDQIARRVRQLLPGEQEQCGIECLARFAADQVALVVRVGERVAESKSRGASLADVTGGFFKPRSAR